MSLLLGHDEAVAAWVAREVGAKFYPPLVGIGVESDEGFIVGGVVFHDFNGSNVEVTVALNRPIRRSEIQGLHHYAFQQLGVRRVTFRTMAGNRPALRFLRKHATFESALPAWFPNGDAVQFRVDRDDARWARLTRVSR